MSPYLLVGKSRGRTILTKGVCSRQGLAPAATNANPPLVQLAAVIYSLWGVRPSNFGED